MGLCDRFLSAGVPVENDYDYDVVPAVLAVLAMIFALLPARCWCSSQLDLLFHHSSDVEPADAGSGESEAGG